MCAYFHDEHLDGKDVWEAYFYIEDSQSAERPFGSEWRLEGDRWIPTFGHRIARHRAYGDSVTLTEVDKKLVPVEI